MASGDTKTQQYLDVAANGTRADLPTDTCCETRTQTLIRGVAERIMDVEDEVERLENNPDVADIVATYADLQSYPTSQLTDKDVVRVLQDETHDGSSTYYRWSTTTQTWTYIGESKQYSDFVGTDGTAGGQNGLVPAPVATDAGKFLNANGSWEEVQAGPTVVQSSGTSTTDVMSQNAVTRMVFEDPATRYMVRIGTGAVANDNCVAIGRNALSLGSSGVGIGNGVSCNSGYSVAIGEQAHTTGANSVAIGRFSNATQQGQFDIGAGTYSVGYNNSNYRLLTGLYDPQSAHDAATKGYVDAAVAGAGGSVTELTTADYNYPADNPTYIAAWLLEPGLYRLNGLGIECKATTTTTISSSGDNGDGTMVLVSGVQTQVQQKSITWFRSNSNRISKCTVSPTNGLISGNVMETPEVVQTAGTSTSNVMSQNAVTSMVFADPSRRTRVQIGKSASSAVDVSVTLGNYASAYSDSSISVGSGGASGDGASANGTGAIAIGGGNQVTGVRPAIANSPYSVALGSGANATARGQMDISTTNVPTAGYNNSAYRLLTGLYDPQSAHDAANKQYVDTAVSTAGGASISNADFNTIFGTDLTEES